MNRNFIFVFILLATLTVVNAAPHPQETKFSMCGEIYGVVDVKLSPDPISPGSSSAFTISGKLDAIIYDQTFINVVFLNGKNGYIVDHGCYSFHSACQSTKCPIQAGTPFTVTVDVPVPKDLPDPYVIMVGVLTEMGFARGKTLACVMTPFPPHSGLSFNAVNLVAPSALPSNVTKLV